MPGLSPRSVFESATTKQIEALDLAAEGFTSKQIARELEIAPRTADQRIDSVRIKLEGIPRNDLLRAYREWKAICDQTTYDRIPLAEIDLEQALDVQRPRGELEFHDVMTFDGRADWDRGQLRSRPGLRPADLGVGGKLLAMILGAVALLAIAVLLMSFSNGLMSLLHG
ncbi:MAG: LuxR C-terminal-related transcriptional regulator [Erythrobacter sp.]